MTHYSEITTLYVKIKRGLFGGLLLCILAFANLGCAKRFSCEGCGQINRRSEAKTGRENLIISPNGTLLPGSTSSYDTDRILTGWLWSRNDGTTSIKTVNVADSNNVLKDLIEGLYMLQMEAANDH